MLRKGVTTAGAHTALAIPHIILLTAVKGASDLGKFLGLCQPGLTVVQAATLAELEDLPARLLAGARLIGFGTEVVVPQRILGALGFGAYNFHPGSPRYPGWAPHCFAIYERATTFGATAHEMIEEVDAGAIVGTEMFVVPPTITADELAPRAEVAMIYLFRRLGSLLATSPAPLPRVPEEWCGPKRTRAQLAKMREMPQDLPEAERTHRLRAFGCDYPAFAPPPQTAAQAAP